MNMRFQSWVSTALLLTAGVAAVGCDPSAKSIAVAPQVSDIEVTEHVKTELYRNEMLKDFTITVITLKGDVRLIGELANQAQVDEALRIARAAQGSHSIHNELTLAKQGQ